MAKRKKTAKILISYGTREAFINIPDDVAQTLSEARGGASSIKTALGKEFLNYLGYTSLPARQMKSLSVCSKTGMCLFHSID